MSSESHEATGSPPQGKPLAFDPDRLRAKYEEERNKRLRADANRQYRELKGEFAHYIEDPYAETRIEREPLHDEVEVAIIGGGFGGLATGARLKAAGVDDIRIIDAGGDFGGVWYWNRYPGAMCDTAAMVYLPLLEETGYRPSMKYVFGPEIFEHARRIARQFGLYDGAVFSTTIETIEWEPSSSRWIIRTDRGDAFRARFVAMSTGPLNRPKLPGISGIETFAGHSFHTSRWDYGYTGGDAEGAPMTGLGDKRVGIIGTGATGVQCVPRLARDAKELFVFQRTPSSIDVRNNHPIDPEWFATLGPGWQKEWLLNFATLQTGGFADEDLVKDGWTDIAQRIRSRVLKAISESGGKFEPEDFQKTFFDCDDEKMEEIRARVDEIVEDRDTAEKLKPWYRQLCKRPCFHDEYLQAYNLPNCHLVDTDGKGVERIDAEGVWVAGTHYPLDCLVFASGFEFGSAQSRDWGFPVLGRGGERLSQKWAKGMRTLHGIHVHGYPNLFILGLTQSGNLISNITQNLTEAGTTIAQVIAHALETGATEVEVTAEAQERWVQSLGAGLFRFMGNLECTPGYYNNEGQPLTEEQRLGGAGYAGGAVAYFKYIDGWRQAGDYAGLEFREGSLEE